MTDTTQMLTVEKICIVCGEIIWWDNSPLPPACSEHSYREVYEAVEARAALEEATP
jgi:hypothetical protein